MILHSISSKDLLIDAYKFYSKGDARAHDAIKIILDREDMTTAVLSCLEEAKKVEEADKRRIYMQAACFGKKFHPGTALDEFPATCRQLRVMNLGRSLNMDVTSDPNIIIGSLIDKQKFNLALWCVDWLKEQEWKKTILTKWTEYVINKRHLRDEQVAAKILARLGSNPIIPYAQVANKAIDKNRITLAIKLIENESQSSKQIPLLLSLKQYDMVLAKTLSSCDSNLIFMAIFKLKESVPVEIKFLELLKKHSGAYRYYCNYLAAADIQKLIMISDSDEIALYIMDNRLEYALSACKGNKQDFLSHQIELQIRLNKFQLDLAPLELPPKHPQKKSWLGLSVCETIINLIALGYVGRAKDCQRKFEVTDKKFKFLEQIAHGSLPPLEVPPVS